MLLTTLTLATLAAPAAVVSPAPAAPAEQIAWYGESFFNALGEAGSNEKLVFVYIWSDSSNQCVKMYGETMVDPSVVAELSDFLCFSANTGDPNGYKLVERFNVRALPTVLIVKPTGDVEDAVVGLISGAEFAGELQRIKSGKDTVTDFRRRANEAPDDLETQYELAVKLQDCGDLHGYEEVTGTIKHADPKGKTLVAARLFMEDAQKPILDAAKSDDGNLDFKGADMKPMEKYLTKVKHDELRYEGWAWVAAVQRQGENGEGSRKATMTAWKFVPEERAHDYGREVAYTFWEDREGLSKTERKFTLEVANRLVALATDYVAEAKAEAMTGPAEGCGSFEGCSDGEGCGGCGGQKAMLASVEASSLDTLACSYFINGKRSKAIETIKASIELAPESEQFTQRLALFESM